MSELGNRIREIRGQDSQPEFAKRAKLGVRTLIKIESGTSIKLGTLLKISKALGLKKAEEIDLVRLWLKLLLGPYSEYFWIDPKQPHEIRETADATIHSKLVEKLAGIPTRFQEELLKAIERPQVLQSIRHLNEAFDRVHQ